MIEDVSVIVGDFSSDEDTCEDENSENNDIGDGISMVEGSSSLNFEFSFDGVK